jgi:GH25 family lysozyme M1 (1,4-beta-N-acetylmuramidase)
MVIMKKYIYITIVFIILVLSLITFIYINTNDDKIEEDYEFVVIKKSPILNVYEKYNTSEYISITDGKLLEDKVFDTNEIGEHKIEILYLNKNNKKRKAYIDYKVIDDIPPIILGGITKTIKKGDTSPIEHLFISGDNYDKAPKREIIGEYDINNIGEYKLTLKVTDGSNNVTTKDFILKVVDKLPTSKPSNTRTNYIDIVNIHKNENTKIGLDISKWQGDVDFNKLKENNVEFVILRVGYQKGFNNSNYEIDPYFYNNIKKLNELNIPVGVYFYTYATSTKEAHEQALWVIDKIKDYKISLPVVFDWESWGSFSTLNLSLHDINEISRSFLSTIKLNGYQAMNYSSKYYLENIWNINEYPVWLAHYTKQTDYNGEYVMWQLCDDGRIDGINGAVDINVLYDFNIIKE